MKRIPLFFLILGWAWQAPVCQTSILDSAASLANQGALRYDTNLLQKAARLVAKVPVVERQAPRALLTLGMIHWRLQLIAFCRNDEPGILRQGEKAVAILTQAEKAGAEVYLCANHRALAHQLMASTGLANGALHGPRAAGELKKARAANSRGYWTLLVEALNASRAPSFAGGSPKRAREMLAQMAALFPDSADVKIHLADACLRTGRAEQARNLLWAVIRAQPENLLAQKIARQLPAQ